MPLARVSACVGTPTLNRFIQGKEIRVKPMKGDNRSQRDEKCDRGRVCHRGSDRSL